MNHANEYDDRADHGAANGAAEPVQLSMDKIRHEQGAVIGRCGVLSAYYPVGVPELDVAYLVDAFNELTLICRRHDTAAALEGIISSDSFSDTIPQHQLQNILFVGAVFVSRAVHMAHTALCGAAGTGGLATHPAIDEAQRAYRGAAHVQARRELKRATDKNLEYAEKFGLSPLEMLSRGHDGMGARHFDDSCRQAVATGVTASFVNRQRGRLGLGRLKG